MPTILFVEDTDTMQRMYGNALEREGFKVVLANSGGNALIKVEEQHYDVILLDLMLAGMSGLDFLQEGRIVTRYPETKVVVLSNADSESIINRVMAAGVTAYLVKAQYEPEQLAVYLKQLLATSAPSAPADPTSQSAAETA